MNELSADQQNRAMMLRRNSSRVPSIASSREGRKENSINRDGSSYSGEPQREGAAEESEEEEEEEEEEEAGGEPVRMSLMALLAETDREMGLDGSAYIMDEDEDEEDEEEEEEETVTGDKSCCVCMVKHKGDAFSACGHTFCKLCSRELYVQKGNCPLCNGFILEILDVF